ncbi:hypothetical protein OSTOST_10229 [Ostertagia ostertagi]
MKIEGDGAARKRKIIWKTPSRILWFVRHGERVDNVDKAWKKTAERWDDPPLRRINPDVNDTYEPVYTTLPPEHGGDAGCIPRVTVTLRNILAKYPTGNILFISHGSPIAACHVALCGSWNYPGQCTIGKIISATGNFQCEYYGDKKHLTDKTNLREHEPRKSNSERQRLEILMINK